MNETPPSILAEDATGNGHLGQLFDVQLGVPGIRGTALRFNGKTSRVEVPNVATLNPGIGDFSYGIAAKFRSVPERRSSFDLLRKGNATSIGGEYKIEIVNVAGKARARCTATDSSGGRVGVTPQTATLADGTWHPIRCTRVGSTWSATVDGATNRKTAPLREISNTDSVTIAAKMQRLNWSDFFPGDLDEAFITFR